MPWLLLCFSLVHAQAADLQARIQKLIDSTGAEVGVYVDTLDGAKAIAIGADTSFHAASTMKVPVMIELFRQAAPGLVQLDDLLPIKNEFPSIGDGSVYQMDVSDVSDSEVDKAVGKTM